MKAIALAVSARKRGNCCDLARFVLDRLAATGMETELINFYDYRITPCQQCSYECLEHCDPRKGVDGTCPMWMTSDPSGKRPGPARSSSCLRPPTAACPRHCGWLFRSTVLYAHHKGQSIPHYIGLISDTLLLNPWDREIWKDGKFQFHPEYVEALRQQGLDADSSLLIDAPRIEIAKG